MTIDLFPETTTAVADVQPVEWHGSMLDKWDSPRATVRLIPVWHQHQGWVVGWFVQMDTAVDEWHPANPTAYRQHANYPWYRLPEMPTSASYGVACGEAARAAKIVMEQMKSYCQPELVPDAAQLQARIEQQAMAWLRGEGTV
jgi:hypothetical protein